MGQTGKVPGDLRYVNGPKKQRHKINNKQLISSLNHNPEETKFYGKRKQ